MRNITLSIEDDVATMADSYVAKHHTTLDEMVGSFLKKEVMPPDEKRGIDRIFELADKYPSQLENYKFNREEIYDRPIFSRK